MSAAKAKGTRWESTVRDWLTTYWAAVALQIPARPYRPAQQGFTDVGDLNGVGPWIVQAKDWANWQSAIREGLDGAEVQKSHAGEQYGVAVVKRARKGVGAAYAVQTLETWAHVRARLLLAESLLTPEQQERHRNNLSKLES